MHFEILIEDQSGKKALDLLLPKILGNKHTHRIFAYKGIGHIPTNMKDADDPSKRILLQNLPRLLKGYGRTFQGAGPNYQAVVIVVCDLDSRCMKTFRDELLAILNNCNPKPTTRLCFAIEEGEAWLLGDLQAIHHAYPRAKQAVLDSYINDSICGTWERLADAVYPGGAIKLSAKTRQEQGHEKYKWAEAIAPHMDIENNQSPSFRYFRDSLRSAAITPISD